MDFKDKVVVITGGSSGIGKAAASLFIKKNSKVIILARNKDNLEKTAKELSCDFYQCDVSNYKQVKNVFNKIKEHYKKIDILVNNAGFGVHKNFLDQTIKEIEEQMKVNYFGTVYCIKESINAMEKDSHIVNVSSIVGLAGFPKSSAYSAAKFALVGLSESLYYDLKEKNINISVICPGGTRTNFFNHESYKEHKQVIDMMEPEYVAKYILKAVEKNKFEIILPKRFGYIMKGKVLLKPIYMKMVRKLKN